MVYDKGEIPEKWSLVKLGDVTNESKERFVPNGNEIYTYIGLEHIESGLNRISRTGLSSDVTSSKTIFRSGDTLFGKLRPYLKKVALSDIFGVCSTDILAIRPSKQIDPYFLCTVLSSDSAIYHSIESSAGTKMPRTSWKEMSSLNVMLPPIIEQKQIAAILSSVDDAIQAKQAVIDQTLRVKQGLMQQLFTRGIGHTRFKQTEIGEIPEEWEVMAVNEIVSLMKSGLSRRIVPQDIGIPVLISGNIQNGKLDTKELKFWHKKDPQGARVDNYILKDGDILLCFINSLSQIGKLCLYEDIGRSAIYTTNLFRIQLKQTYSPNFGYYIFSAPFFQKEIDLITKPAVNQASFTKADFLRILIPIPPKEEREKIVEILKSVDYSLETAQIQLRKMQKLKRGLMQDLLTGRVRVKLDEMNTT